MGLTSKSFSIFETKSSAVDLGVGVGIVGVAALGTDPKRSPNGSFCVLKLSVDELLLMGLMRSADPEMSSNESILEVLAEVGALGTDVGGAKSLKRSLVVV